MKAPRLLQPISLCILMMASFSLHAQDSDPGLSSAYSFGGSCVSQGAWTQSALLSTQNLRKVTLKLKNDANCTTLGTNMQSALASLETSIKTTSDSDQRATRLSQIPGEISALRSFVLSSPESKKDVMKLMMDRSIEGATISAQVGQVGNGNLQLNLLQDFGSRISRGTQTGVQLLNQVVDELPQLNECLMGDGSQALGNYLSATVKIAAAFGSSGQDSMGSQLATTISKLTAFARNKKFSKVLRTLNKQEFMTSMSCLMEVTSESYCSARDGMGLFKTGMDSLKIRKTNNGVAADNPYAGYYILNTHVPNITRWLQKIQVGVEPKLPTDAQFQNNINQEVTDFFNSVKTLLGDYNSKVITVKALPTLEQKQNAVYNLLVSVTNKMTAVVQNRTNFYTTAMTSIKIPFYLIGMDTVPDQVLGKNTLPIDYDTWIQSNRSSIPAFNDPIALTETIKNKMTDLIRDANLAAIQYFNRWYIVDKAALVNESLTDVNYTVKDSLKAIFDYLELAKQRIIKYKGDKSPIPIIIDTQSKIKIILQAYADIEALGEKWKNQKGLDISAVEIQANADMYEKLINTVYEQFNVMNSKSGFLANRMITFVYKDYDLLLKNSVDFTPYQQDLFNSQGMAAFDRMLQLYNGNPANIQSDLNMALRVNTSNLDALEMLLKDSFTGTIAELKMVSESGPTSSTPIFLNSMARMINDMHRDEVERMKRSYGLSMLMASMPNPFSSSVYWFKHSDRYPLSSTTGTATSPQSEFDDASAVQAQLCIQALAFNDQVGIQDVCSGTVLKGPLSAGDKYNASYDKLLVSSLNDKKLTPQLRKAFNHSQRVCAFRDYNRQNMVLFMQMNQNH
jgi:hypothetical protein